MAKDMTVGKPSKILINFSLPIILSNIFQQLYNVIDSIIVGNFVGAKALAAVGASSSISFLFVAIATGLSIGSSIVISQFFGAKKIMDMRISISTSLLSMTFLGFIFTIIGVVFSKSILILMNTPSDILYEADLYLKTYFVGLLPLFLYNISTSIFNALGNSKTPLYFLIFSSILNVILDLVFIIVFSLGTFGAAFATLIAQTISSILCILYLFKRLRIYKNNDEYDISINEFKVFKRFDSSLLKKISLIAVPTMIQQSIVSLGLVFMQSLVNSFGSNVVSGYTAASKIDSIAIMPIVNIGNALSTFTAQNIGASKSERVEEGYKATLMIEVIFSLIITSLLFIFGSQFIGLFVDASANTYIILIGVEYLRVVSLAYVLKGISGAACGVLKGAGDMKFFMLATLSNFGLRVISAYALSPIINEKAIWYSIPIGWAIELIISLYRYHSGKWKSKGVVRK